MDESQLSPVHAEMFNLVNTLPEEEMGHCHLFTEENENIVFLEVERGR